MGGLTDEFGAGWGREFRPDDLYGSYLRAPESLHHWNTNNLVRSLGLEPLPSGCILSHEPQKASRFVAELGLRGLECYSTLNAAIDDQQLLGDKLLEHRPFGFQGLLLSWPVTPPYRRTCYASDRAPASCLRLTSNVYATYDKSLAVHDALHAAS